MARTELESKALAQTSSSESSPRHEVAVIIINYNGRGYLDELLRSLQRQTFQDFSTLLIDNGSQDGSVSYVRNNFAWVRVLAQPTNLGFSRAANLGAKNCETTYLALLNPDVKLDPEWLQELVRVVRQDPNIAAVASKMRLYHQPRRLNGVGGAMNSLGYTWDRGMWEEDRGQYDHCEEVLFASAGAALFRRAALVEAGGFDERFFMDHEDVDLCWRLWLLGGRVVTAPRALAYHHFGGSTQASRGMEWRERMGERHNIRTLIKNYQLGNLVPALARLALLPQPFRRKCAQYRNFLWNLYLLPDTLGRRRWIQNRRCRCDQELQHLIVQSKHVPISL
ncbi:MAG: glycosyltransferase family 2 protein [Acidobacteriota bacterium]